ncbi:MAG: hypothetical protein N3A71_02650 [Candidatus Dojkabacteria bacterium]|nr:hypothetical protein [Candidatus Dojkabacteria bacterium]
MDLKKRSNLTKIFFITIIISTILIILGSLIYNTPKQIHITSNTPENIDLYKDELKEYLSREIYFKVNPADIENELKMKYPFIQKININKLIIYGFIINVEEFLPVLEIRSADKKYFYIDKNLNVITSERQYKSNNIIVSIEYQSANPEQIDTFILKNILDLCIKIQDKLEKIQKIYFDNLGMLTIILNNNKSIKLDLTESFSDIGTQIEKLRMLLEDKIQFNTADLRFKDNIIVK